MTVVDYLSVEIIHHLSTLIQTRQKFLVKPKLTCAMHLKSERCSAGVLLFSSVPVGWEGLHQRICLWAITFTVSKLHCAFIQNKAGVQVSSKISASQDVLVTSLLHLTSPCQRTDRVYRAFACTCSRIRGSF